MKRLLTCVAAVGVFLVTAAASAADTSNRIECGLAGALFADAGRPIALDGALYGDVTGSMDCQFNIVVEVGGSTSCLGEGRIAADGQRFFTRDQMILIPSRQPGVYFWLGRHLVVDGGYGWLTSFGTASLVPVLSDGDPEVYELDLHFSGAIYPDRRPTPPVAALGLGE